MDILCCLQMGVNIETSKKIIILIYIFIFLIYKYFQIFRETNLFIQITSNKNQKVDLANCI